MLATIKLTIFVSVFIVNSKTGTASWTWTCNQTSGFCSRQLELTPNSNLEINLTKGSLTQELCRLTCGDDGIVWPKPSQSQFFDKNLVNVDIKNAVFKTDNENPNVNNFLKKLGEYFKNSYITGTTKTCNENVNKLVVIFEVKENDLELTWDTDEQYVLNLKTNDTLSKITATIRSKTIFGARHGIETLSQLINQNGFGCYSTIKYGTIEDRPAYRHRGLLIDTARNFLSLEMIKNNIRAMAMSKLNVLHWHLTDSQSFPFVSSKVPNLTRYGAYSDAETYKPEDIKELIEFAKIHGVRIIPEIDSPAHAGNGWQWASEAGYGNVVTCFEWQPYRSYCIQPPCGQMNPINKKLYDILGLLYADLLDLWPNMEAFHMGGDEVFIPCWNSTPEIVDYLGPKNRNEPDFLNLWGLFQSKAVQAFDKYANKAKNTSIILWTSTLTDPAHVQNYLTTDRYVIQSWEIANSTIPHKLLDLGYKMIISTKDQWYLDHGFWGSTNYHKWRQVFENRIPSRDGVLGGEVCSWGEFADDSEVEPRIWPRASAAAERLWSNPAANVTSQMVEKRFFLHRERLVARGIKAAAMTPKYCVEQEGGCPNYALRRRRRRSSNNDYTRLKRYKENNGPKFL